MNEATVLHAFPSFFSSQQITQAQKMIMQTRFFSYLVLSLCLTPLLRGQHYWFADANSAPGNLNIHAIAEDRRGRIWAGTENGLYRYNGFRYQKLGPERGITGHNIRSLLALPDGSITVVTEAGIFRSSDSESFSAVSLSPALTDVNSGGAITLVQTPQKQIALLAEGNAYLLHPVTQDRWNPERLLAKDPIYSLFYDAHGDLWFGCGEDLCHQDAAGTRTLRNSLHLPADQWLQILQTNNGHLWLRGRQHIAEVAPLINSAILHDLPTSSATTSAPLLTSGFDGSLITTQANTVFLWKQSHWQALKSTNGLDPADISALFTDHQGVLWVAQTGHGLRRWIGQGNWELHTTAEGLGSDVASATIRDQQGRLWVATQAGLYWYAPRDSRPQRWKAPTTCASQLQVLTLAPDGSIWGAGACEGLLRIDPHTLQSSIYDLPTVHRMAFSPSGELWAATVAGIYYSAHPNKASLKAVTDIEPDSAAQNFYDLNISASGEIWTVGENGLFHRSNQHWQHIDPGLSHFRLRRIAFDHSGNLWAAGDYPGLLRLRISANSLQETEHIEGAPLLSNHILDLLIDHLGRLWVGQDHGISVFDGVSWRSYTQSNGLPWNDCRESGLTEDRDGSLWIGTSGGLAHLLHAETLPASDHTSLSLEDAFKGSQHFTSGGSVLWDDQPLQFTFAAPDYSRIHPALLHYRLLGRESTWNLTTDGTAHYPQLPPGEYLLEVTGEDESGNATSTALEIPFHIEPRWSQVLAVPVLAALLLIVLITLWLRFRNGPSDSKRTYHTEANTRLQNEQLEQERKKLRKTRERIRSLSEYDDLTGLWNQRIIIERLRIELERSRRHHFSVSILRVDIDGFRRVNELLGFHTGDRILQEISRILLRTIRSYDWVGRLGGSEFLIILPGSGLRSAQLRADALRSILEAAQLPGASSPFFLTACFGVASGSECSCDQLLRDASLALLQAKQEGYNHVVAHSTEPAPGIYHANSDQASLFFGAAE